jgi:Type II secretory pathway, component PulD
MKNTRPFVIVLAALSLLMASCASPPVSAPPDVVAAATQPDKAARGPIVVPPQVSDALQAMPMAVDEPPAEPRFDLAVNNAQARDVFLAMVADTRYSMLMHPEVKGTLSVTLRGVTVREALEAIRDVYGYDFKIDGRRITVYPPTLQTRIYNINYLNLRREGRSDIRVSSGAQQLAGTTVAGTVTGVAAPVATQTQQVFENSHLSTTSKTDFWVELADALRGIIGAGAGRNVVVSPQSGVVAVRAMPDELRQVDAYLKAARISVERQVMLEAKIVEVQLREGFQSGVDWSILRGRGGGGVTSGSSTNALLNPPTFPIPPGLPTDVPLLPNANTPSIQDALGFPARGNGLFGLVFGTKSFEGVLAFLQTQGTTQILSSPRVAALNNQRAVLKVGTDELFVTGVTGGTITSGVTSAGAVTTLPTITLSSYFSGIALDVMAQVDDGEMITLHIHPSVSSVTEVVKNVDLGGSIGQVKLPLPANSTNETDTVVRAVDGYIVAIGGLMQTTVQDSRSGLPGTVNMPVVSGLLGNQAQTGVKREIVVLLKPTIIRSAEDWREQAREVRSRMDDYGKVRVITLDGPAAALGKK